MRNISRVISARNVAWYSSVIVVISIIICVSLIIIGRSRAGANVTHRNQFPPVYLIGLPDNNVLIEDASNKSFDSMFAVIGNIPKGSLDQIRKYSVMLINNSNRPIAAYTIKWEFEQNNGKTLISDRNFIARRSFQVYRAQAHTGADHAMMAVNPDGGSKLVSLINSINEILPSPDGDDTAPLAKIQNIKWDEFENKIAESVNYVNGRMANCRRLSVTLDQVIFTDGVVIGKDTLNNLERIKAKMDGERDLYENLFKDIESLKKASPAESRTHLDYSKLFTTLESDTNSSDIIVSKEDEKTSYRWRPKRTGNRGEDHYNNGKLNAVRNILIMRKIAGDERAIDHIIKTAQSPRVYFYKDLPNKQRVRVQ
jgi:hypothetical protein